MIINLVGCHSWFPQRPGVYTHRRQMGKGASKPSILLQRIAGTGFGLHRMGSTESAQSISIYCFPCEQPRQDCWEWCPAKDANPQICINSFSYPALRIQPRKFRSASCNCAKLLWKSRLVQLLSPLPLCALSQQNCSKNCMIKASPCFVSQAAVADETLSSTRCG